MNNSRTAGKPPHFGQKCQFGQQFNHTLFSIQTPYSFEKQNLSQKLFDFSRFSIILARLGKASLGKIIFNENCSILSCFGDDYRQNSI